MQVARELPGQSGHRFQLLPRGGEDRVRRTEVVEQGPFARGADPGKLVEDRRRHRSVAADPVVRDGEPVRLVAHALQELELRGVVGEPKRLEPAGDEDLLDPLRE